VNASGTIQLAQDGGLEPQVLTTGGVKMDAAAIIGGIEAVTKKWAKQRKAEERESSRAFRRRDVLTRIRRLTIRDAAFDIMEQAYLSASTNGTLPAHARQIFYQARGPVQERTGDKLVDQYFTQTLLPDYLIANPETTADWDVVFDARGHFTEPHTERVVPLGTIEVRNYLNDAGDDEAPDPTADTLYPTNGPRHRFNAVLFIEKEGFMPLFRETRLAERFDIAIMSTKGMSVTASRLLVDRLCGEHDIPLLVLHDFDKSGFSIVGTLRRDTRRYSFGNDIRVVDLGLRLADARKWKLEDEEVSYGKSNPTLNLQENGATPEEIAFLHDRQRSSFKWHVGRRVELNAFTSGDLINWIESGLTGQGVKKVVPDAETLEEAYRRAAALAIARQRQAEVVRQAEKEASELKVPRSLVKLVRQRIKDDPTLPWDLALEGVVAEFVKIETSEKSDSAS
jgi:hypothetical protein